MMPAKKNHIFKPYISSSFLRQSLGYGLLRCSHKSKAALLTFELHQIVTKIIDKAAMYALCRT